MGIDSEKMAELQAEIARLMAMHIGQPPPHKVGWVRPTPPRPTPKDMCELNCWTFGIALTAINRADVVHAGNEPVDGRATWHDKIANWV